MIISSRLDRETADLVNMLTNVYGEHFNRAAFLRQAIKREAARWAKRKSVVKARPPKRSPVTTG